MNSMQIIEFRKAIVEARQRILDRLKELNNSGDSPPASVDRAEIELLEAKIALEESS